MCVGEKKHWRKHQVGFESRNVKRTTGGLLFNSARLTTIILSVIVLGLTMSAPVGAGTVLIDNKVKLDAGGNTIAGPGIVEVSEGGSEEVFLSKGNTPISATIHCRKGTGAVVLAVTASVQQGSPLSDAGKTTSARADIVNKVTVLCAAGDDCECIWRVDRDPLD